MAPLGKPCCGGHPTYKVEEDGRLAQLQSSSAKRGGLAADVSSGLIFLKKKKKDRRFILETIENQAEMIG